MDPAATCVSNWWLRAVLGVALIAAPACSGSRSASDTRQAADQSASASGGNGAATTSGANPGIDLNCLFDRVQNPPEAFHYSFTHDSGSAFVAEDADLTPQQIDGTLKDRSGAVTKTFHGVRSDPAGWQAAWSNLTAVSSASSTFALVRGTDATVRQGEEQVNGYDTVKYSIDTTQKLRRGGRPLSDHAWIRRFRKGHRVGDVERLPREDLARHGDAAQRRRGSEGPLRRGDDEEVAWVPWS